MATVVFSGELKSNIITKATEHFVQTKSKIAADMQKDMKLYNLLLQCHLPQKFIDAAWLAYSAGTPGELLFYKSSSCYFQFLHSGFGFSIAANNRPIPHNYNALQTHVVVGSNLDAYLIEILTPYVRADKDEKAIVEALNKLFDNVKTLNQAEKVMPNILDWCDAETIQRLRHKAERQVKDTRTPDEIFKETFGEEALAATMRARVQK